MRIRVLDLETENYPYLGAKSSPHCPDNYVVMLGYNDIVEGEVLPSVHYYWHSKQEALAAQSAFDFTGVDIIVAHNAMFEISWFLCHYNTPFLEFLKRGGRVICTQLAEYLLSDQTWTYPPLDEVAPLYGGTHKVDAIKLLWEQGKRTSEIDPELLTDYLVGEQGDIPNTTKVFLGQHAKLIQRGQWDSYLARCEGMLAFAFCEYNGLFINKQVAADNKAELEAETARLFAALNERLLPADLPEGIFKWSSDYHVSALLFGGSIKYDVKVPYDPPKFEQQEVYELLSGGYVPLDTERTDVVTYKSGINKGKPKAVKIDSDVPKLKWGEAVYTFKAACPIEAMPLRLRDNFVGRSPSWRGARVLTCGTPVYSTSGEVLQALAAEGFEAGTWLYDLYKMDKDLGTYYHKVAPSGKESGMLLYVGDDNIIHHNLNMTSTVTTRLSHTRPNLGNLPRKGTSKVKQMFTSRFGDDGVIIEVDYTALEVVMLAALSGDSALLEYLLAGTDMHSLRLAAKLRRPYEEIYAIVQDKEHPEHEVISEARTNIKPVAFAAQYGASASGLAYNTGVSLEYAEDFLANEEQLFPRALAMRQEVLDEVRISSKEDGRLHREQFPDGTFGTYRRGVWKSPGGTRYSFRQHNQWDQETKSRVMDFKKTEIANYWCQGESGFLMTVASGLVIRYLIGKDLYNGKALLINNVHDALYLDCHKDVAREVALSVKAYMQHAPVYMSQHLGYNIEKVPFPAVAEMGISMYSKDKVE